MSASSTKCAAVLKPARPRSDRTCTDAWTLMKNAEARKSKTVNSLFPEPSAWKRRAAYLLLLLWWWKATSPIMAMGWKCSICAVWSNAMSLYFLLLFGFVTLASAKWLILYSEAHFCRWDYIHFSFYLIPLKAARRSFLLTKAVWQTPAGVVKSRVRLQVAAFDLEESGSECKAFVICWLYFLLFFKTAICWMCCMLMRYVWFLSFLNNSVMVRLVYKQKTKISSWLTC